MKVTLCQRVPRPSYFAVPYQFHSLVVSLSDRVHERVFMAVSDTFSKIINKYTRVLLVGGNTVSYMF